MQLTSITIFTIFVISTIPFVLSYEYWDADFTVPSWIKNNAGWWADDQINDNSFVSGIQWMITNDVIILPPTELGEGDGENVIPRWVKTTAGWWSNDEINDSTFVAALRYLITEGIIIIEQEVEEVQEVEETSTDIEEIVEMKEFDFVVNDHSCALCTNWGYTGTEYYFQIKTFDEHHGSPIDGVTINAKIISKGGELRHDFGALTTEDGIYNGNITIPGGTEWFGENILFITAEYYGVEKTIEKEFDVFIQKRDSNECESENPFDLSGWETLPTGITFESGGSKMFVVGSTGDDVNEYTMQPRWCIGNAQFMDSFSVSGKETSPQSLAFSTDGTKMFILGLTGKDVTEYTLGTAFDVSTATYVDEKSVDEGTDYDKPRAVDFNSDGTKMRILWSDKDSVGEYVCSTGFDVSTCSYTSGGDDDISGQEANALAMAFNSDGTKMFIAGFAGDDVNEYTLSTAYDVSTATFVDAFSILTHEGKITGLAFDTNGHRMFIVGQGGVEINEYYLTVAWDVSTASHK